MTEQSADKRVHPGGGEALNEAVLLKRIVLFFFFPLPVCSSFCFVFSSFTALAEEIPPIEIFVNSI